MSRQTAAEAAAKRVCMFGTATSFCGRPAYIHVIQGDGSPTFGCSEHVGWWQYAEHQDNHPVGSDCGMPGTYWWHSTPEDGTGLCFTLTADDTPDPRKDQP